MPATKHYLSWDRPLPAQAAAWLAAGREGKPLDLSDTWVVVPTRQAGRRLREAIARHAHSLGTAALAPKVTLAEAILETGRTENVASSAAVRLHWARTLLAAKAGDVSEIFPNLDAGRTFAWAIGLAERFAKLRRELAEGGLRIRDVAARAGAGFPETERWAQIAALESAFLGRIGDAGFADPEESKLAVARAAGEPPSGIKRVVLIGCPDPMSLALEVLEAWSKWTEVAVVIHAPAERTDAFDAWGRPLADRWPAAIDDPADFENCVHVCSDPVEQASRIAAWATRYEKPDTMLAIGAADKAVVPFIATALTESGVAHFDPDGQSLARTGLAKLIALLRRFAEEQSFGVAAELARRPEILEWLSTNNGPQFRIARFLTGLDELESRHLPATLEFAIEHAVQFEGSHPKFVESLKSFARLADKTRRASFPGGLLEILSELLGASKPDRGVLEEATAVREAIDEAAEAGGGGAVDVTEGWELTLAALSRGRLTTEKPAGALEILGWLELLWEDAPHVVVSGMNEGRVPESVTVDAFLPGSLREELGLRTNADRLARDGYILAAVRAARGREGRLDLLVGRHNASGDPLHPSRLLLACEASRLPERVRNLFRSPPPRSGSVPWSRAWTLKVPRPVPFRNIGVTAFRDYLACPFRFYLKHGLRMESVEPEKRELDVLDFGTLVHSVLEQLGKHHEWRDCTDGAKLAGLFSDELDRIALGRFGPTPSLPLVIQIESAKQRLRQAAFVQAATREDGWRIEEAEWKFPEDAVVFDGLVVRGKIDRIERHLSTGVVRVLDYKTSDRRKTPSEAHRTKLGKNAELRFEFAACEVDGKPGEWTDLQLPLYRLAAARFGGEIVCGYFNLPKAVTETAIEPWGELDDEMQKSAIACAHAIATRVNAGVFWPPNEDAGEDDFTRLFHEGIAASIDPATVPDGGAR